MKITTNNNLNKFTKLNLHTKENSSDYAASNITHKFDAITIQSSPKQIVEKTFAAAVSKEISSDISTPLSDRKLQQLQSQIADGTYQIDSHTIACKMLLLGEGA